MAGGTLFLLTWKGLLPLFIKAKGWLILLPALADLLERIEIPRNGVFRLFPPRFWISFALLFKAFMEEALARRCSAVFDACMIASWKALFEKLSYYWVRGLSSE